MDRLLAPPPPPPAAAAAASSSSSPSSSSSSEEVAHMRQFPSAPHPEIMRAEQKDSDYLNHLCQAFHDTFRCFFGTTQATAHQNEIKLIGQVFYYTLTTGLGVQTLGEEYSNIIQVAGQSGLPLTPARRLLLVMFQTAVPYAAERMRREISRASFSSMDTPPTLIEGNQETPPRSLWQHILWHWPVLLPSINEALTLISRANLMLFYFKGLYYDVAKRAAGVQYALLAKPPSNRTRYHMLGVFLLIQLCITGGHWFQKNFMSLFRASHSRVFDMTSGNQGARVLDEHLKAVSESHWSHKKTEGMGGKCTLCLGPWRWPTSTPCGHVFCWECVAECCNQKPECPLCRAKTSHSELVPIYNADFVVS